MGFFSFLFAPAPPCGAAPRMPLRRFSPTTSIPPADYVVIDIETTGLDACVCEILEIGAIRYQEHKQVAEYHSFVKPEGAIPTQASNIHHITWRKVAKAPSLTEIAVPLFDFIGNDTLVGFNIEFDIKFLQTRLGIDIKNTSFDVLSFVRECFPGMSSYKLDALRNRFSLGGNAHSALGDCIATANLLKLCSETENGKYFAQQAIAEQLRFEAEQAACRRRREESKARKATERASGPSLSELRALSKNMVGDNFSYIQALHTMLQKNGRADNGLCLDGCPDGYQTVRLYGHLILGVKTTGNLRYVVLDLPTICLRSNLVCAPSSLAEGSTASRIFISSPDKLSLLEPYILDLYDKAAQEFIL